MGMGIYWHRGVLSLLPIFCSTSGWQDSSLPGSHQELLRTVLPGARSSGRWQACFLKWSHTLETLVLICLASDRWPQPQENVLHSCLAVQRYRLEDLFPQPNRTQNSACRTALSAQYPSHHKFHHRQQRRLELHLDLEFVTFAIVMVPPCQTGRLIYFRNDFFFVFVVREQLIIWSSFIFFYELFIRERLVRLHWPLTCHQLAAVQSFYPLLKTAYFLLHPLHRFWTWFFSLSSFSKWQMLLKISFNKDFHVVCRYLSATYTTPEVQQQLQWRF